MNRIAVQEGKETITELYYQWQMGSRWYNVTNYYSRYPQPMDGDYTIAGVLYRLQHGVWYIVSYDGSVQIIEVETSQYDANGIQERYFYKFGGQWYQFINNGFQLQNSYVQPTVENPAYVITTNYQKPAVATQTVTPVNKYLSTSTSYLAPAAPTTNIVQSITPTTQISSYNYQKPYVPKPITTEEKAQYQVAITTVGSSLNPVVQPAAKPTQTGKVEYISKNINSNFMNFGMN
jgi:hypothetical protein